MSGPVSIEPVDPKVEALLGSSLRTTPLRPEALASMRAAVQHEWRQELARRSRTRVWAWACAASLAVAAVVGGWQMARVGAAIGIMQQSASLTVYRSGLLGEREVTDRTIRVGDRVQARADALIRLAGATSLRLRSGTSVRITAGDEVQLRTGAAYLDFGAGDAGSHLHLRTPLGVVEHLGTQFEAAVMDGRLRVRVREGAVRVAGTLRAQAGEELMLDASGAQQRRGLPAYDKEWTWVQAIADAPGVEGQSALVLLRWVARETGRQIEFADGGAEKLASSVLLHGSIDGLPPDVALRAMLATTSLEADVQTARIVVHSANPARS